MLIVEGTDLTGKTTLCKKLLQDSRLQDLGYVYRHLTRLPDGFDRFWGYVYDAAYHTVQDRFHMSEIVYSYARKDKKPKLSPWVYNRVDAFLRLFGAFTVVLIADDALLEKRYHHGEMYDLATIKRANDAFTTIAMSDGMGTYSHVHFNMYVHLTKEEPWVNDEITSQILDQYIAAILKQRSLLEASSKQSQLGVFAQIITR